MSKRLVDAIRVRQERSQSLVESVSIASIFPPYSSDTESETSSESIQSSPRFSCSIDTLFSPARSPSQSPRRLSVSIETFFHPARSPSQSDSSEDYEEIFPIDPFISTSSRRTRPMRQKVVIRVNLNNGKKNARAKALQIAVGVQGVESVSLQGEDSSQIVVVGNDIDSVHLTSLLRKKVGSAVLMSLAPISYEGEKQQEPKQNGIQSMLWPSYLASWPTNQARVPYYYTYDVPDNNQDSCTIT